MAQALGQAILSGDADAVKEILEGFVRAQNVSKIAEDHGFSRIRVYQVAATGVLSVLISLENDEISRRDRVDFVSFEQPLTSFFKDLASCSSEQKPP